MNDLETIQSPLAEFARSVRAFVRRVPISKANEYDAQQLVESSGKAGASILRAAAQGDESSGTATAPFLREACGEIRLAQYWLGLVDFGKDVDVIAEGEALLLQARELSRSLALLLPQTESPLANTPNHDNNS